MVTKEVAAKFWALVEKSEDPDACWLWKGGKSYGGHGVLVVVRNEDVRRAHRVSWEIHNRGKLPSRKLIGHTCKNKICVNPKHLVVVTQSHWHIKNPTDKTSRRKRRGTNDA